MPAVALENVIMWALKNEIKGLSADWWIYDEYQLAWIQYYNYIV